MKVLTEDERGQTRVEGNAFIQDSKISDAAEVRVGAPKDANCSGGGKVSFDVTQRDAQGNVTMRRAIAELTCGEGIFGAEFTISVLKKDGQTIDSDMVKAIRITQESGIEFLLPTIGLSAGGHSPGRFYHEGGRFVTIYQDDGHVVTYDTTTTPWRALWGNWEGNLVPPPWL